MIDDLKNLLNVDLSNVMSFVRWNKWWILKESKRVRREKEKKRGRKVEGINRFFQVGSMKNLVSFSSTSIE